MGTAVLRAQDCLNPYHNNRHEVFTGAVYHFPANSNSKSKSPQRSGKRSGHGHWISAQKAKAQPEQKRPIKPKVTEYKVEDEALMKPGERSQNYQRNRCKSNGRQDLLLGSVTILKRGETVESSSHMMGWLGVNPRKTAAAAQITGSAGLEPKTAGKNAKSKSRVVITSEEWAGPAFANSPSPSSLPLPKFSVKKTAPTVEEKAEEELPKIDYYATKDLRRLLGLV